MTEVERLRSLNATLYKQLDLLRCEMRMANAEVVAARKIRERFERVLDAYEAVTSQLPLGDEIPEKGCSTYNWRRAVIKDLREMLAEEAA